MDRRCSREALSVSPTLATKLENDWGLVRPASIVAALTSVLLLGYSAVLVRRGEWPFGVNLLALGGLSIALGTAAVRWSRPSARDRLLVVCLLVYFVLQALVFVDAGGVDDKFITLRYAKNLADGAGFTFNPGEAPVEGYSNFALILLEALMIRCGVRPDIAPTILGILFGCVVVVALWHLTSRALSVPAARVAVAMAAGTPMLAAWAVGGLETTLYCALMVTVLATLPRESRASATLLESRAPATPHVSVALATIAALTRPEGVLLLALSVVTWGWVLLRSGTPRATVFSFAILWLLPYTAYYGWRTCHYQCLLPLPFYSKANQGILDVLTAGSTAEYLYVLVPIATLALLGLRVVSRNTMSSALTVCILLHTVLYARSLDWFYGARYWTPLLLVAYCPLSALICRFVPFLATSPMALLIVPLLSLPLVKEISEAAHTTGREHYATMLPLGRWFNVYTRPDATIAMSDVGVVPYYSSRRTIDIFPKSLCDKHLALTGWDADYVLAQKPDYFVFVSYSETRPLFYPEHTALAAHEQFAKSYRRIGVWRQKQYPNVRCYWVYCRTDCLPTEQALKDILDWQIPRIELSQDLDPALVKP